MMAGPDRVGTDGGGFRLTSGIVEFRIEGWGYWTPDVISAFRRQAPPAARKLGAAGLFVFDATNLKPQGTDGQDALCEIFRLLAALPFARGSVMASNVLSRMQITRLLREGGLDGRVTFD
jgi:hypothetical protein